MDAMPLLAQVFVFRSSGTRGGYLTTSPPRAGRARSGLEERLTKGGDRRGLMEERVSRRGKLLWCFLQIALFSSVFLSGVPSLGHVQTTLKMKRREDRRR